MKPKDQVLHVWGDFACFTRPEMKVERFSYPVITPSAARGIFDSIYCKPNKDPAQAEFSWRVTKIEVLAHPSYIALRRNEVKDKGPSERTIASWISGKEAPSPLLADGTKDMLGTDQKGRTQRQTMALKNVSYRLHGYIHPWPGQEHRLPALEAQFARRASAGKCFCQPSFGCREFPAFFELEEDSAAGPPPVPWSQDIGLMLYDVFDLSRPGRATDRPCISLFRARVEGGVMDVPEYESPDVLKGGGEAL